MMLAVRHMENSRVFLWVVVVVLGVGMMYGGDQLTGAHQFSIQNVLNDSVMVDCYSNYRSNGEQVLWAGKRYYYAWSESPGRPETWVCGFSWLGTTYVKQFQVWNRTTIWGPMVCDICEWKVDTFGFSIQQKISIHTSYRFMYEWDTSCLTSSSNLTDGMNLSI